MKITIKNCRNIDNGEINILEKKLNIKFGSNGTGKSTLAKALEYKIKDDNSGLISLLPFKLQKDNPRNLSPEVIIEDGNINTISIFNEEYVNQFLFKQDELIANSFEIFIKTPAYIEIEQKIKQQLGVITKVFEDNTELEKIILDFQTLSKSFKTTQNGLSNSSSISKGLSNANLNNIPDEIQEYSPFIQDREKCVDWLSWQIQGNKFIDGHDKCPYCISPTDTQKKEYIKKIEENYDKNIIKNFIEIIRVLENLGDYFSYETKNELKRITQKVDGLLDEEKNFLVNVKGQIDSFLQRLNNLKGISFFNLKDEDVPQKIKDLKINIDVLFDKLKSEKTENIIESFNEALDETLEKIVDLQRNIGEQKKTIKNAINKNQKNINHFLRTAGYKYQVSIQNEGDKHKIKLQHIDFKGNISGGNQYLSFGERNAFALVLFMYEALSKNSDLIILDDPISSFDKNKKYAILQMLFREADSFKNKTVLMLTHDMEPIIDTVKSVAGKFKIEINNRTEKQVNVNFIESRGNILQEKVIEENDILTFPQIFQDILQDENIDDIVKLVYMRRNFEVLNDKGDEYQILSDLFHKRTKEEAKIYRKTINSTLSDSDFEERFQAGEEGIKTILSDFDYEKMLNIVNNNKILIPIYQGTQNGYEKLQIFRIINGTFSRTDNFSDAFKKFVNETYHIENDFIFQLNPKKYDLIPEFIIEECDKFIEDHLTEL